MKDIGPVFRPPFEEGSLLLKDAGMDFLLGIIIGAARPARWAEGIFLA